MKTAKWIIETIPGAMRLWRRYVQLTLRVRSSEDVFTDIYVNNKWGGRESVSGPGSDLRSTQELVRQLPMLFREYGIESILDIPCGDFNWMNAVSRDGISYAGGDIVAALVGANTKAYAGPGVQFLKLDIACDRLPEADLVICRDGLVHMSYEDISRTLANVCTSNSRYLLTTSFVSLENNSDIVTGEWRPINLERPPFRFPQPLAVINDYSAEGGGLRADKSMAPWEVAAIPRNFEL